MTRRIVFITGTRADYGKLKTLIKACDRSGLFDVAVFVTGMHMLSRYGNTIEEIRKQNYKNIYPFINQGKAEHMEIVLANTISGLSRYLDENLVDLIVVHGDRPEALAGAIVGGMKNILVAHVEGGERSGTIDESIRHSITKFSHHHFVTNEIAADRIRRLGERPNSIHIIGSPNVDIIVNGKLPSIKWVRSRYQIRFSDYAILIYHPVTTELKTIGEQARAVLDACSASKDNFVLILPNNDMGSDVIYHIMMEYNNSSHFRLLPSIRFEAYLTLLSHAKYIIGNSSSGIHEAPLFGVPTINIGTRQNGRFVAESIVHSREDREEILGWISWARGVRRFQSNRFFGDGSSADRFLEIISSDLFFQMPLQKEFCEDA